jgi:DNA-binding SARP family transcriptional activator
MEFRILGPLDVRANRHAIDLGGGKQRALLAVLLLRPGETVSTDLLLDALWGEHPPASAASSMHAYVSRLRKALGRERLARDGRGYRLVVEPEELDLDSFRRLLDSGRERLAQGDAEAAAETLRKALSLWRGPPLADFAYEPFAAEWIARLGELRLEALEERIDAELALGRHRQLVAELDSLVREHPLRERLRGQQMLALYRSGRQVDALQVYRSGRRLLDEELGLEPDDALQRLEKAILNHDPSLAAPDAPDERRPSPGHSVAEKSRTAARRRRTPVRSEVPVPPDSVAVIDPERSGVVGHGPVAVAGGHGSVWVANADDGTVSRIDPDRREVIRTIGIGAPAIDLGVGPDAVWVANGSEGTVSRIDPSADVVVETIDLRGSSELAWNPTYAVDAESEAVWIAAGPRHVVRIYPATNEPVAVIDVGHVPVGVAFGDETLWVATIAARALRVEPHTNAATAEVPIGYPVALTAGDKAVWVSDSRGQVWRINPETAVVTQTISIGRGLMGLCATDAAVWAAIHADGTVVRIDPENGEVVGRVAVGHAPTDVCPWEGVVWVSTQSESAI